MVLARMGAAAWRLLTDVRFAVLLITLLALAGLVGMLVRQFPITAADDPARYAAELATMQAAWGSLPAGTFLVDTFDRLGLFSVFSTPWFLLLMTVLVLSIICCTLDRTPRLWRSVSHVRVEQPAAFFDDGREHRAVLAGAGEASWSRSSRPSGGDTSGDGRRSRPTTPPTSMATATSSRSWPRC